MALAFWRGWGLGQSPNITKVALSYRDSGSVSSCKWSFSVGIYTAQTAEASSGLSMGVVETLVSWLRLEPHQLKTFESILRTMAHFGLYFVLGILMYREVITVDYKKRCSAGRYFLLTVFFCFLYAISDEIHQYFVPGRSMQLFDVMVDTAGAALGAWLISILIRLTPNNSQH